VTRFDWNGLDSEMACVGFERGLGLETEKGMVVLSNGGDSDVDTVTLYLVFRVVCTTCRERLDRT